MGISSWQNTVARGRCQDSEKKPITNKVVYTATFVAGGWAWAVMSWAGAVMIWAMAVKAVCILKAKVGPTDRPTNRLIGRVARDKKVMDFLVA